MGNITPMPFGEPVGSVVQDGVTHFLYRVKNSELKRIEDDLMGKMGLHRKPNGTWSPMPQFPPLLNNNGSPLISRNIYVGGLSWNARKEDIISYFENFAPIEKVEVMYAPGTKICRGFAFVVFKKKEDAEAIVYLREHELNGNLLHVRSAINYDFNEGILAEQFENSKGFKVFFDYYDITDKLRDVEWNFDLIKALLSYFKTFGHVVTLEGDRKLGYVIFKDEKSALHFVTYHHGFHIIEKFGIRTQSYIQFPPVFGPDVFAIDEVFENVGSWHYPINKTKKGTKKTWKMPVYVSLIPGFLRDIDFSVPQKRKWTLFPE